MRESENNVDLSDRERYILAKALAYALATDKLSEADQEISEAVEMRALLARLKPNEVQRIQMVGDAETQLVLRGLSRPDLPATTHHFRSPRARMFG
jgi:hypothetical protein